MKKILLLLMVVTLWGCMEAEPEVTQPEVIIERDEDAFHSVKLYAKGNTIPHLIRFYDEMDDASYGSFIIEVYDSKFEEVWTLKWRDLIKRQGAFAEKPQVHGDKLIVNVHGVVSVHDLLSGEFLWEVESVKDETAYAIDDDILYVLYYGTHTLTAFDLETGAQILDIDSSAENLNGVYVDERNIVIYERTSDPYEKNGFSYSLTGDYLKKVHMGTLREEPIMWEDVTSSDESETAQLIIDGSLDTVWEEQVKGYGEKEFVELTRNVPVLVNRLVIYNGNHSSEKAFEENAKIKRAEISIGDGKSFLYEFSDFEYGRPEIIELIQPVLADYVLITIEEVTPGTTFKTTGITEVYTE